MELVVQKNCTNWKPAFHILAKDFLEMKDDEISKDVNEIEIAQSHSSDYSNPALILQAQGQEVENTLLMELVNTLQTKCHELQKKVESYEKTEEVLEEVENQPSHLRALVDVQDPFSHTYPTEIELLNQDLEDIQ